MNSWKLNGIAGHLTRSAICKGLNIHSTDIYKIVKSIDNRGIIKTQEGKKYELVLKEVTDDTDKIK
jgi:sugar-specific transcriptional regulator TrmB